MMALPSGFSPFVEFSDETQQWRWIGKKDRVVKFSMNAARHIKSDFSMKFKVNLLFLRPYSGCREGYQCSLSAVAGLQRFGREGSVFKMHFQL